MLARSGRWSAGEEALLGSFGYACARNEGELRRVARFPAAWPDA